MTYIQLKRICIFVILMMAVMTLTNAQINQPAPELPSPPFAHSAVYAELLGQGILYSLNYDYRFSDHVSMRVGFSSWSIPSFMLFVNGTLSYTGFPIMLNYLAGKGSSRLELGAGIVPSTVSVDGNEVFLGSKISGSGTFVLGAATIGYRMQPRSGGLVFRIGLTPLVGADGAKLYGGISLGGAF